jgi:XTP/dITP diphosphohydrolase
MKKIYFITTNDYKFKKFSEAIKLDKIEIVQLKEETPEIQAENNRKVAEFSVKWAADKFNRPVIKEDVGMYIEALNGFPGPYLEHVEKQLKTAGFLRLLNGMKDRSAYWEYAIAFCEPSKEPKSFYTQHKGTIAKEARGKSGWYADKIFILEGKNKTVSELLDANEYVRNDKHYQELKKYLQK